MLCKLAWGNVRRAGRDYLVYLLTLTLGVTVFYAFNTISMQVDIAGIDEKGLAQVMGSMLGDLTYFLAGVMAFLMVYANNFIMKRRKKEFGLYQVLGMERGRVATIMALETVIVSVVAFVAGIVLGVGLSQLMTSFTASLFKTQIANFHFFFSMHAFNLTLVCMLVMFVLTLLLNLRAVRRTKLIELMGAERRNESIKTRNPWIAIAIFAVGVVLVGVAYYRLLRDGFPLTATDSKLQEAMSQFGITTAMVTVGTFALFWGLSGMLIKLLQSLRSVYWRGLNMFTVRQLSAKVNTVCFSMGVIAMILFLAITSVTCGMSIANVMNENLERYNPVDVSQTYVYYTPDTLDYYKEYVNPSEADRMVLADTTVDLYSAWHGKGKSADNNDETGKKVNIADVAGEHVQIDSYLSYPFGGSNPSVSAGEMCKTMGEKLPKALGGSNADTMGLFVTPASQYNKLRQMMGEEPVSIGRDSTCLRVIWAVSWATCTPSTWPAAIPSPWAGMSSSPQPISRTRTRRPSPTRRWAVIRVPSSLPTSCCPNLICSRIPVACSLTTNRGWIRPRQTRALNTLCSTICSLTARSRGHGGSSSHAPRCTRKQRK